MNNPEIHVKAKVRQLVGELGFEESARRLETPIQDGAPTASPAFHALPRSRSSSESKVEEIIATLWTILWAILFVNHAPVWMLWISGLKAISDHMCAMWYAIREIRSENALIKTSPDEL